VIVLRGHRRTYLQWLLQVADNRMSLCSISTRWLNHIFSSIHRKIHNSMWSICFHDFLWWEWFSLDISLSMPTVTGRSLLNWFLCRHNHRETDNLFRDTLHQLWITPANPRIVHGYHRKSIIKIESYNMILK